jgi:AcrR family transcriptional regulator
MEDSIPSRRDRKKLETRRALRWAALDLIAERGYTNVTVEDIAVAADVSTRTFFNYFSSKEAAVVGEDPEQFEQMRTSLLARPPDEDLFSAVRAVFLEQCEHVASEASGIAEDPREWFRRMRAVHNDADLRTAHVSHLAKYERLVVAAIAERAETDLEHDPYPALLAASAVSATRIGVMYWAKGGGVGTPVALVDAMFSALAGGLVPGPDLEKALESTRANGSTMPGGFDAEQATTTIDSKGACA